MESGSNHELLSLNSSISHYKKEMNIIGNRSFRFVCITTISGNTNRIIEVSIRYVQIIDDMYIRTADATPQR